MSQLVLNSIKGSLNVITGCGSGLGKATLQWLLKQGSGPVLGIDNHIDKDFESSLELNDEQKSRICLREHNTFDEAKVESSLKDFVTKNGAIDNLINVAGVSLAFTMITESSGNVYDLKHAQDLSEFNILGTFNVIRLASRYMIDDQLTKKDSPTPKCIVNASCISTTKPSVGQTFYAASKSAIDSMTLCIARELSPFNIRCNTINVGYFATKLIHCSEDKIIRYLERDVSLCPKRLGHPDEFAHLVQAIIENPMLNGSCIKLDGGADAALDRSHGKSKVV